LELGIRIPDRRLYRNGITSNRRDPEVFYRQDEGVHPAVEVCPTVLNRVRMLMKPLYVITLMKIQTNDSNS
jgi:hypothetical protein